MITITATVVIIVVELDVDISPFTSQVHLNYGNFAIRVLCNRIRKS